MIYYDGISASGQRLRAYIQENNMNARPMFSLTVQVQDWNTGRWYPEFDHSYTTQAGAEKALLRRYPTMKKM